MLEQIKERGENLIALAKSIAHDARREIHRFEREFGSVLRIDLAADLRAGDAGETDTALAGGARPS